MARALACILALGFLIAPIAVRAGAPAAQDDPTAVTLPGVGDPVTFPADPGGEGTVTITVTQLVDPFAAFGATAEAGSRYVYVGLTVVNGTDEQFSLAPATLFVVDTDGIVYRPDEDIFGGNAPTASPEAELQGGVVFAVPEDATLVAIYHDPAPDRLILLAFLGVASQEPPAVTPPSIGGGDETPTVSGTPGTTSGEVDCAAFTVYYEETNGRLEQLNTIVDGFSDLLTTLVADPTGGGEDIAAVAAQVAGLADAQADADVPPGLEDLNDDTAAMFQAFADAFDDLATSLTSFDFSGIQAIQGAIQAAGTQNEDVVGRINDLAAGCGIEVESE